MWDQGRGAITQTHGHSHLFHTVKEHPPHQTHPLHHHANAITIASHELCPYLHSSLANSRAYLRPFSVFTSTFKNYTPSINLSIPHRNHIPQNNFLKCLLLLFTLRSCICCSCFLVLISPWPDDSSPLALQAPWLGLCLQETQTM